MQSEDNRVVQNCKKGFLSDTDIRVELKNAREAKDNRNDDSIELDVTVGNECKSILDEAINDDIITPVGVDLSLGDIENPISLKSGNTLEFCVNGNGDKSIEVPPGDLIVFFTRESIRLGKNVAGLVHSKVNLVNQGFSHISTTVDPGWEGEFAIAMQNNSSKTRVLYFKKTKICTVTFYYCNSPAYSKKIRQSLRESFEILKSDALLLQTKTREEAKNKERQKSKYYSISLLFLLIIPFILIGLDYFFLGLIESQGILIIGVVFAFVTFAHQVLKEFYSLLFQKSPSKE